MSENFITLVRWKPIPGWEGLYDVTDDGRVWSRRSQIFLSPSFNSAGYPHVGLSRSNKCRHFTIHRLVLLAFVGPCPEGMECCHKNHSPSDNRLPNLRWDTKAANLVERDTRAGIRGRAKLGPANVLALRLEYSRGGLTQEALAARYGVSLNPIHRALHGQSWKHVGGPIITGCS